MANALDHLYHIVRLTFKNYMVEITSLKSGNILINHIPRLCNSFHKKVLLVKMNIMTM